MSETRVWSAAWRIYFPRDYSLISVQAASEDYGGTPEVGSNNQSMVNIDDSLGEQYQLISWHCFKRITYIASNDTSIRTGLYRCNPLCTRAPRIVSLSYILFWSNDHWIGYLKGFQSVTLRLIRLLIVLTRSFEANDIITSVKLHLNIHILWFPFNMLTFANLYLLFWKIK